MKTKFYDFTLDTNMQTLHFDDGEIKKEIELTNINFQVLLFFINHPNQVINKDQLINEVWAGKLVTDNSIDQSISKVRKSLADFDDRVVIKTVYGKGYEFVPENIETDHEDQSTATKNPRKFNSKYALVTLAVVSLLLFWLYTPFVINEPKANKQSPVIWLNDENESDWLDQSSHQLINQIFLQNSQNYLLDSNNKPSKLSNQQYVENYWRINPDLQVISSTMNQQDDVYTLRVQVTTKAGDVVQQFTDSNLLKILTNANQWLSENSDLSIQQQTQQKFLPNDPHVIELHMRALHAYGNGELDQALNYAQLATDKEPSFGLAKLNLAQVLYAQGNNEASLSTLDEIKNLPNYAQLTIAEQALRGDILDTSGQHEEAVRIYQKLLDQFPEEADRKLLPVKFNMSYPLNTLHRYDEALTILDEAVLVLHDQFDLGLLADVLHRKGSILLQVGRTAEAKQAANTAYQHYNNLSDLMGSGKVSGLLARIANHEADYELASDYLQQSLGIYRHAEFPLGVGATLNELIYVQMSNGLLNDAWTNTLEMRQIAQDIDYFSMLMAAQQFEVEISRTREQWLQTEAALAEYFRLSTDNNFSRGLFKHQLFELDLALDQKQVDRAKPIITAIQKHIDTSNEIRLQPRLNVSKSKILFFEGQSNEAIQLINQTKSLAQETQDYETIHDANNLLLDHFIEQENNQAAMSIINEVEQMKSQPLPHPYQLLKSKVYLLTGDHQTAIKWANSCKNKANELWMPRDEAYLSNLIKNLN